VCVQKYEQTQKNCMRKVRLEMEIQTYIFVKEQISKYHLNIDIKKVVSEGIFCFSSVI